MAIIYKIENPIGEKYVGSTKRELRFRKTEHKYRFSKGKRNKLYDSFKRFGFENHDFSIVCDVNDEDSIELEHFIISEFNTDLNSTKKHNATASGKIWVNNGHCEFQILPKFIKDYNNIKKGRLTKKN